MKFDYVYKRVKEIYPKITEEEITELLNEALQTKTVQQILVNCIGNLKMGLGRD